MILPTFQLSALSADLFRSQGCRLPVILGFMMALGMTAVAPAAAIITIEESGSDVVATLAGSIDDLTGATLVAASFTDNFPSFLRPDVGQAAFGSISTVNYDIYSTPSVPVDFGTSGFLQATASSGTSYFLVRNNSFSTFFLDSNYVLGTSLSGTATYAGQSFASLGITQGAYAYTWTGDSITINVVPEPTAIAFASIAGLAAVSCVGIRRRRIRGRGASGGSTGSR